MGRRVKKFGVLIFKFIMKLSTRYALLLCLFLTTFAYANITIDGEVVHVETDGYTVQFDRGVMTYIHNKHTDKTYTISEGNNGWSGMLYHRYFWDGVNISTNEATLVSATQLSPNEVELLFRQADTDILLTIAVDPLTDDLLIDMEGVSETRAGVIGMQWGCDNLDIQNLSVILPKTGGRIIDANTPDDYIDNRYPNTRWEAQLVIVQGGRGGFYVRNTDDTLQFKRVLYARLNNSATLNFTTYNQAPFDSHTTGQSRLWRFNTYAGDWRVPARIYRDWMGRAFEPRRLSDIPWAEDITLFVSATGMDAYSMKILDRLAELVDPTKTLVMLWTWADGGAWWSEEREAHHPDYFPKPELGPFVKHAHQHGFRVMPAITAHGFSPTHPLYPDFEQYQYRDTWTGELLGECWDAPLDPPCDHPSHQRIAYVSAASRAYRDLVVQRLKSVWEEYGVDGFFLDANHFVINDGNGLIDGLNMAQGMALLHKELADAMPGIMLGGEMLHEATFAHTTFAQRSISLWRDLEPHPISAFLFSPFTHAIAASPKYPDDDPELHQELLDYGEVWGMIPTLRVWQLEQLQGQLLTHELLESARNWEHQYGLNGDVNGDGIVNILDLTLVGQNIGAMPLSHPQADINGDGLVNVLDLVLVSNMFER